MLEDGLDKPISPQMAWIGWSHNPEVAGSNPAPATQKGPAKQGLLFAEKQTCRPTFYPIFYPLHSRKHWIRAFWRACAGSFTAFARRVRKLGSVHLQGNLAGRQQAQLATRCGQANASRPRRRSGTSSTGGLIAVNADSAARPERGRPMPTTPR